MKLATFADGSRDGRLGLVDRTNRTTVDVSDLTTTLQDALERWNEVAPPLRARAAALDAGQIAGSGFDPAQAMAPLPRSWQWLDGSAFQSHGDLMSEVFKTPKLPYDTTPLMYQGMSHRFLSGLEDVALPSEEDFIDFEGEFGVITDDVPMGTGATEGAEHIRLVVLINDWSLRRIAPVEMKTGFGWVQAKPACSVAPLAVTPDELGGAWRDGRVCLPLHVQWNRETFGRANGEEMAFSFPQLVAHAARTRDLVAGTLIGSGTVSNASYREVGSSCIAERRGIESYDTGEPVTPFMSFGDTVQMEATSPDGVSVFGRIDQRVVKAGA
jgi:fumarylacetoacetate (FAA) hydrolase